LERASSGLVFSSETGRPFEFFALAYPGRNAAPSAADFAKLIGEPNERSEEISLANFFAPRTATSDPYDSEAQKMRPRYDALVRTLSTKLRDTRVYLIGSTRVVCYVAGLDTRGNLAGLTTLVTKVD
jgi:hypothetical protein